MQGLWAGVPWDTLLREGRDSEHEMGTMSAPWSIRQAKEKNVMGIQTGGCFKCILEAQTHWKSGEPGIADTNAKTQWPMKDLRFIQWRQYCWKHYKEEMAPDF